MADLQGQDLSPQIEFDVVLSPAQDRDLRDIRDQEFKCHQILPDMFLQLKLQGAAIMMKKVR